MTDQHHHPFRLLQKNQHHWRLQRVVSETALSISGVRVERHGRERWMSCALATVQTGERCLSSALVRAIYELSLRGVADAYGPRSGWRRPTSHRMLVTVCPVLVRASARSLVCLQLLTGRRPSGLCCIPLSLLCCMLRLGSQHSLDSMAWTGLIWRW